MANTDQITPIQACWGERRYHDTLVLPVQALWRLDVICRDCCYLGDWTQLVGSVIAIILDFVRGDLRGSQQCITTSCHRKHPHLLKGDLGPNCSSASIAQTDANLDELARNKTSFVDLKSALDVSIRAVAAGTKRSHHLRPFVLDGVLKREWKCSSKQLQSPNPSPTLITGSSLFRSNFCTTVKNFEVRGSFNCPLASLRAARTL